MYKVCNCPICYSNRLKSVSEHTVDGKATGWSYLLNDNVVENYKINSCLNCGLVFRNLRFSDADMDILYGSATAPKHRKCRYEDYYDRSTEIVDFLTSNTNLRSFEGFKILDVGGGRGEVTEYFTKLGCRVDILEFDATPMEISEDLRVIGQLTQEDYDLVIFSHILEHITEPVKFLNEILQKVKLNSLVYLEVPYELVSYYVFNTKGHYEHLNYFNSQSLKNMIVSIGGNQICVEKKLGFGQSLPVISGVFYNNKTFQTNHNIEYKSPLRDSLSLDSIVLYVISKIRQITGKVSKSHKQ